jgi:hypothetical protein
MVPLKQTKIINAYAMNLTFDGTVSETGKLSLDKLPKFQDHLRGLAGKRVQLTVERMKHTRSNGPNRYYWGVVVDEIAKHTGHDPEQIHELLKQMFSPQWTVFISAKGERASIPTSTTRLDTIEFTEYTERCRVWANELSGLQIPLPGEVSV